MTQRKSSARSNRRSLAILLGTLGVASPVLGTTLRIAEYNIDCSDQGNNNNITGASAGVPTILQAMGVHAAERALAAGGCAGPGRAAGHGQ